MAKSGRSKKNPQARSGETGQDADRPDAADASGAVPEAPPGDQRPESEPPDPDMADPAASGGTGQSAARDADGRAADEPEATAPSPAEPWRKPAAAEDEPEAPEAAPEPEAPEAAPGDGQPAPGEAAPEAPTEEPISAGKDESGSETGAGQDRAAAEPEVAAGPAPEPYREPLMAGAAARDAGGPGPGDRPDAAGERTAGEPSRAAAEPARETVVVRKGGFWPMLLGGVVAAGLGFGAFYFVDMQRPVPPDLSGDIAAQAERIEELETEIAVLAQGPDFAPVREEIAAADAASAARIEEMQAAFGDTLAGIEERVGTVAAQLSDTQAQIAEMEARLTDVEQRPTGEATLPPEAIAAYEREVSQLNEAMEATRADVAALAEGLREEVGTLGAEVRAELARLGEEAAAVEQAAEQAQARESARAALTDLRAAVQAGGSFAAPLEALEASGAVDVPEALRARAEAGVPSLALLRETFPEAARDALAAARAAGVAEDPGGIGGFLRGQLNIRSVEPRAGDDPDAVLSRAGAALDRGDLAAALDEIATLPEAARLPLQDWTEEARARVAALGAVRDLNENLNMN